MPLVASTPSVNMSRTVYTVWAGGGEVNSSYIESRDEAISIANSWKAKGYKDVIIQELELHEDGKVDIIAEF